MIKFSNKSYQAKTIRKLTKEKLVAMIFFNFSVMYKNIPQNNGA